MSAHRTLNDLFRAFDSVGPGRLNDPGDAGTITVGQWGQICSVVTEGVETRTWAQPTKPGILAAVVLDTDGGDLTLTVTGGYNQAGDTAIVFGTAGDWASFISVKVGSSYYWRIVAQEGTNATLTGGNTITSLTATTLKMAVTAVAATGSAIGNAAALSMGLNVVSAADNTKAVILPVAEVGAIVAVKSSVNSKTLPVFPQVGSAIDQVAANGAATLGAAALGAGGIFIASTTTQWRHFPIDVT